MPKVAALIFRSLQCDQTTGESGKDEIYMEIYVDGNYAERWPSSGEHEFKKSGGTHSVEISVNIDLMSEVRIKMVEKDGNNKNEIIMDYGKTRKELQEDPEHYYYGTGHKSKYKLHYTVECNPIATVRVHGIKCEAQCSACNDEVIDTVAGLASQILDTTASLLRESKSLKAQTIGLALDAASTIVMGVAEVAKWLAEVLEGKDDIYMVHRIGDAKVNVTNAFFPCPPGNVQKMERNDVVHFESYLGNTAGQDYFRFPIDNANVKIEIYEKDAISDVEVGSIVLDHNYVEEDPRWNTAGVSTVTKTWGTGKGAVYHVAFSVGYDDWTKSATLAAQDIQF